MLRAFVCLVVATGAACDAVTAPPPPVVQKKGSGFKGLPALCVGAAGAVAGGIPACRRSIRRLIGSLSGDPINFEKPQEDSTPAEDAASAPSAPASSASKSAAGDLASAKAPPSQETVCASSGPKRKPTDQRTHFSSSLTGRALTFCLYASSASQLKRFREEAMADAEKFALTPDKLGAIADLNERLEAIAPMLAPVPVFTAAVGNGTSPLTVPTEDGRKLAYFFVEKADAVAFLDAIQRTAKVDIDAKIIGASLSDIIKAYSAPDAKNAKETFVLIPTMAEVAAARQLMRAAGKDPTAPELVDKAGPHSGLVPVFWSESLAVQTAGGQQRKILFFRMGDLSHMWKNLSSARQEAGEMGDEMPSGPTVQVSDLQTMAGLLVEANKTDDVMFLPSSKAIREVQQQQGGAVAGARRAAQLSAEPRQRQPGMLARMDMPTWEDKETR